MKTYKKILAAFILNIAFSIFELIGGLVTNSVSIMSDAIHDFGDALSIGISLVLEKISKRKYLWLCKIFYFRSFNYNYCFNNWFHFCYSK